MNWIESQCGSPRWTLSNMAIASRKNVLRRFQLRRPSSPAPPRMLAAAQPSPTPRRWSGRRAKSRRDRIRSVPGADQLAQVTRQNTLRINAPPVRLAALTVSAKVGHDHAKSFARRCAAAWPNLIQFMFASENRPWSRMTGRPSPQLVIGELDTVGGLPKVQVWTSLIRETCRSHRPICRRASGNLRCASPGGLRC